MTQTRPRFALQVFNIDCQLHVTKQFPFWPRREKFLLSLEDGIKAFTEHVDIMLGKKGTRPPGGERERGGLGGGEEGRGEGPWRLRVIKCRLQKNDT